jgi:hypothetical protein
MVADLCTQQIRVGDWHSKPCGRPAVEDGLCKLHLRVRERQQEKDRKWAAEAARDEKIRAEARELSAALGISVKAESTLRGYTGDFVVSVDWLRSIAKARED